MNWTSTLCIVAYVAAGLWAFALTVIVTLVTWNLVREWWLRRFKGKGHYAGAYLQAQHKPFLKRQLEAMEARGEFMWRPRSQRD